MRILVTNDDGIDSVGLHVLARAMRNVGEVLVVAPDQEYSGCGAALWPMGGIVPEVSRASITGINEVWAVKGPPALCVILAWLGACGDGFDLVVSGINPGTNLGRSVNHSGTIGACTTARSYGISGIAVSQAAEMFETEIEEQNIKDQTSLISTKKKHKKSKQRWQDDSLPPVPNLRSQEWDSAANVAIAAVSRLADNLPESPVVMNINVPNLQLDKIKGWKRTEVGIDPLRAMQKAILQPRHGHTNTFEVRICKGEIVKQPVHTDGGAVMAGWVSVSWLGSLKNRPPQQPAQTLTETALDDLFE